MNMTCKALFLLPAFLGAMSTASAALIFFDDFEGYLPATGVVAEDPTYVARYSNPAATITIDAGTGLGGGKAWNIGGDPQIRRDNVSVDLVNGAEKTAVSSIFFRWAGSSSLATAQIGFTTPTGNVTGTGDLTGRISDGNIQLRNTNATAATKARAALTTNNWYQMVYTLERTATLNTFNAKVEIFNSSNTGVAGSLVDSLSMAGIVNATLWSQANLKPIIRDGSTISAFDNYQVITIPEPSTMLLVLCAGSAGLLVLRRRKA